MDNNKPEGRKVTASGTGKKLGKKGEGLGTGPVNNMGNYEDRNEQHHSAGTKPVKPGISQTEHKSANPLQSLLGSKRPSGNAHRPATGNAQRPSNRPDGKRPGETSQDGDKSILSSLLGGNSQNPSSQQSGGGLSSLFGSGTNQQQSSQHKPANLASMLTGSSGQSSQQSGSGSGPSLFGGNKKIIMIIIAAVLIYFLYKSMTGSNNSTNNDSELPVSTTSSQSGTYTDDEYSNPTPTVKPSTSGEADNLMNLFMGSAGNSNYDYDNNDTITETNSAADTSVSGKARSKFTKIKGNNKDVVTMLIYMCGTDLESQSGMATADLKEMLNATVGKNVNLLVYTGGCSRWRNNVVSNQYNEIYQISDGQLFRLEDNLTGSMTNPATLASFIKYGKNRFNANRMCLILWDHGGGSVSGYGYDEKTGRGKSMTLGGLSEALEMGGVKFDFIGFDACLMATVENGLMLSKYADYMIASEETEPGVGWYYTQWLTKLSKNTSMPTVEIGKMIADDFVDVCAKQCRGQATTLSVVDLAELQATVPTELTSFSKEASKMIKNKEYQKISKARGNTREFAQSSRIDQIDLVDFATRLGTKESKKLAKVLQNAVKYNRTGGGISNAYGLSIYFPYQRAGNVKNAVSAYQNIGMDEAYTRCIQEFASLEASGQVSAAGQSYSSYSSGQTALPGLLDILGGGNAGSYSGSYGVDLTNLLGDMLGGGSSYGGMLDLFTGRDLTIEEASEYITENHVDNSLLTWQNNQITLPEEQANLINDVALNVYYDVGDSYLDLGMDDIRYTWHDNTLINDYNGVWLHFDDQPVAFYHLYKISQNESVGYVPVFLKRNGTTEQIRANLIILVEGSKGTIIGAQQIYGDEEKDVEAKNMIGIGAGDQLIFLCDCFGYDGRYQDTFPVGDLVLTDQTVIDYKNINGIEDCRITYCLTDIYNQRHWTSTIDMGN